MICVAQPSNKSGTTVQLKFTLKVKSNSCCTGVAYMYDRCVFVVAQ